MRATSADMIEEAKRDFEELAKHLKKAASFLSDDKNDMKRATLVLHYLKAMLFESISQVPHTFAMAFAASKIDAIYGQQLWWEWAKGSRAGLDLKGYGEIDSPEPKVVAEVKASYKLPQGLLRTHLSKGIDALAKMPTSVERAYFVVGSSKVAEWAQKHVAAQNTVKPMEIINVGIFDKQD